MLLLFGMAANMKGQGVTVTQDGIIYTLSSEGDTPYATVTGVEDRALIEAVIASSVESDGQLVPVTSIGRHAFWDCKSLTSVTISEGVIHIWNGAFGRCSSLTSIEFPSSMDSFSEEVFYECTSLVSIILPGRMTSIEDATFDGCTSLTSVTIPSGVVFIGSRCFSDCTSLASIELPAGVNKIEEYAFHGCTALADIFCHGQKPATIEAGVFDPETCINATLYVPKGSKATYAAADGWKDFVRITESESMAITVTEVGEPRILGATLYTPDGKKVRTLTAEEAQSIETLTAPQRGIYLLVTQTDRGVETRKVIK